MADTHLILHVKGTDQTTTLPKPVVRAGIAQGQITHSQLIWSPADNAWKQVREMPNLLPSQKLAPAPPPRVGSRTPRPGVVAMASVAHSQAKVAVAATPKVAAAQPRIAGQPKIATPRVAVAAAAPPRQVPVAHAHTPAVAVAAEAPGELVPPDESALRTVKWVCLGVGALLLLVVAFNYFFIDRPLTARLADTPFAQAPVHAHLGAFIQPNALIIHVFPSSAVNESNLTAFLVTLARNTPDKPGSSDVFDRVSLTPSWLGRYSFAGTAWDQLGTMSQEDAGAQKDFILSELDDASGTPLAGPNASDETREQVWSAFLRAFTRP